MLQFSYFFLLLINVTSTYITYMTVVIAWMLGTLIGLVLPRLNATIAMVLGVAGYYATYAWTVNNPLSPITLPLAAVGVAITGLWAGRFFVVMRPLFVRVDRMFLHENNGFLVGIIMVFVGFTMVGRPFLLWTPLVSLTVLLANMAWLGAEHHHPDLRLLAFAPARGRGQTDD